MEKIIIAAVAENGVIGKDGDIPWHHSEDLEHFREKTMGNPVVMGRSTYESLPEDYRPLPGRTSIVLSRSLDSLPNESAKAVNSLDDAWEKARETGRNRVFIAGGASVYKQVLPEADRMVLTRIHEEYKGDTFFPEVDWSNWEEVSRDDRGDLSFLEYRRKD